MYSSYSLMDLGQLGTNLFVLLVSLLLLLIHVQQANGEPVVSQVSGTVAHGLEITIIGSAFGTKSKASPRYFNTLETDAVGELPSEILNTSSTGGRVSAANERIPGRPGIQFEYSCIAPEDGRNCESWSRDYYDFGPEGFTKLFMSYWLYLEKFKTTNTLWQWKHIQFGSASQGYMCAGGENQSSGGIGHFWEGDQTPRWFGSTHFYYDGCTVGGRDSLRNDELTFLWDRWQRIDWQIKSSSSGGVADGSLLLTRVGTLPVSEIVDGITNDGNDSVWRYIGFGQGITNVRAANGGAGSTVNLRVYYGDLYIDTSWARVELGDKPVYGDCSHRELQVPSAWSDESVTVTVNKGGLNGAADVYLFVVDEKETVPAPAS